MQPERLQADPECLLFFIDETGHETLAPTHEVYGVGGCAVFAADLESIINARWRLVRKSVSGSENAPLHASNLARNSTKEQREHVREFFERSKFFRFAAIASRQTKLTTQNALMQVVFSVLADRIDDIAGRVSPRYAAVIFEHSQRTRRLVQNTFSGYTVTSRSGRKVPTELLWLKKTYNEPAMEVADFVMHAAHRQERNAIDTVAHTDLDFKAVFVDVPSQLISFMRINAVFVDGKTEVVVAGEELR